MMWQGHQAGWAHPLPLLLLLTIPRGFLKAKGNELSRACVIFVPGEKGKIPFRLPSPAWSCLMYPSPDTIWSTFCMAPILGPPGATPDHSGGENPPPAQLMRGKRRLKSQQLV